MALPRLTPIVRVSYAPGAALPLTEAQRAEPLPEVPVPAMPPAPVEPLLRTPVPSSHLRPAPGQRAMAIVVPNHEAIKNLMVELKARSGLTDGEIAARMGVTPQALSQARIRPGRRPSFQWMSQYASVCGARIMVEFPPE